MFQSTKCTMKTYAYIRVSTLNQSGESQIFEIEKFTRTHRLRVDKWVSESISGTVNFEDRKLGQTIRKMSQGDLLICTEISRLGRNMLMIMGILNECSKRGIRLRTIKDNFDLSDSINSKIIAFAFALASEIERNLISQRTREALAAKKAEGVRLGRPPGPSAQYKCFRMHSEEIKKMKEQGFSLAEIAREYKIHRNTLARYLQSEM